MYIDALLIVEVNQLLVTWKVMDRMLMSMCTKFLKRAKQIGCIKGLKKSTAIFVQNWSYGGNNKEKRAILILNWGKKKKLVKNVT